MKLLTMWEKIKTFFTKKKIIWIVVVLLILLGGKLLFGGKSNTSNIQTDFVKQQDIQKTVLSTGQVVSSTDLSLSWSVSGIVKKVFVKEGDTVHAGQLLAQEDTSDLLAQLHSAEAGLTLAKEQKSTSTDNVANVTNQQDVLVKNAYINFLNSTISASSLNSNNPLVAPSIVGTYTKGIEGNITFAVIQTGGGGYLTFSGIISGVTEVSTTSPQAIGDTGLYIQFPSVSPYIGTTWKINIPNTTASNYLTNYNAYQLALETRDKAIADAQASVGTVDSSIVVDAKIAQAQASVDSIIARIENTKIIAPSNGTITQVDTKVGELAQATKEIMKLLNVGELHTEALVSEADIASVAVGQSIDNTFDALGPDKHFTTTVLTVNPASTIISGVVNYKVTGSLEKITGVKPGMTANMTIKVAEKQNALVIPSSAIINKNGKHIVRVVNDPAKKTYTEVEVQTGLEADGGLTEIILGLNKSEEVVTYIK